jgi:hypothetical protein
MIGRRERGSKRAEKPELETGTDCANPALKGHEFTRAEEAQKTTGFNPSWRFSSGLEHGCNQLRVLRYLVV